jgi:hypothetical protein
LASPSVHLAARVSIHMTAGDKYSSGHVQMAVKNDLVSTDLAVPHL